MTSRSKPYDRTKPNQDPMQKSLEKILHEAFSVENMIMSIITKKLKNRNIVLNEKQCNKLRRKIKTIITTGKLNLSIDENETLACPQSLKNGQNSIISLSIDESNIDDMIKKIENININELISDISSGIATDIYLILKKNFQFHNRSQQKRLTTLNKHRGCSVNCVNLPDTLNRQVQF